MHQLIGERQNTHVVLHINVMEHAGNKLIIKKPVWHDIGQLCQQIPLPHVLDRDPWAMQLQL